MKNYLEGSNLVRLVRGAGRWIGSGLSSCGRVLLRRTGWISFVDSFKTAPLRMGGLMLMVAVLTHLSLLLLLARRLTLGGWLVRLSLLVLGLLGLMNGNSWNDVWQGSLLVRFLKRGKG